MTDCADKLRAEQRIQARAGVVFAVPLCEALVRIRLRASRRGGCAPAVFDKIPA